jgi:flagellar motility protein MotE (MotC chaperone)
VKTVRGVLFYATASAFLACLLLPASSVAASQRASASSAASSDAGKSEEARLLEMRQDLEAEIQKNQALVDQIKKDRDFEKKLKTAKIRNLTAIYEKMPPRTAASQVNMMSDDLALLLISGMNPRKASRIMQYVDPKVAIRISLELSDLKSTSVARKPSTGSQP